MGLLPAETTPRVRFIGSILALVAFTIALSWNHHRARHHRHYVPHHLHHQVHFRPFGRC